MNDEQRLLRASLAGDCRSFERLVEHYQALICAITFSATGRVDTSEELAQETFLQAWKNLFQLKDIDKFRSWLCSIARNLILTHYRQKHANKVAVCDTDTLEILATQACPSSAEIAISREEEMILSEALMQLPEEYREPLVLFYRQHQSTKEVAQSLDMNEATVRTRLSRGRQMLKDKVSAMVERTLEKTGPGKQFTKAVMVSIGAGLAAGTAATAGAAATGAGISTAAGSSSAMTAGLLTAAGTKAAAIAAAVILTVGVAIYSYSNSQENTPVVQPTQQESVLETNPQTPLPSPVPVVKEEIKPEPMTEQAPIQPVASKNQLQTPPAKPQARHPDWPGIDEPVLNFFVDQTGSATPPAASTDDTPKKLWIKLPRQYRMEDSKMIYIDNGKERIHVDKLKKTVQQSYSMTAGNTPVFAGGQEPLHKQGPLKEDHFILTAKLFRHAKNPVNEPNAISEYDIKQVGAQDNGAILIYQLIPLSSLNYDIKAFVDAATLLPEKLVVDYIDPNKPDLNYPDEYLFDFSPIPDSLFNYQPQPDETQLPHKEPAGFHGHVVDLLNNPIAGAEVYVNYNPLWGLEYLKGTTDSTGLFEIKIPDKFPHNTSNVNLPLYFWAILPDRQDFAAWTILYEDCDYLDFDKDLIPGYGGTIVSEREVITGTRTENGITTPYPTLSSSLKDPVVKDIVLVMQPTGTIAGYVMDKDGYSISGAQLTCKYQFGAESGKIFPLYSDHFKWTFSVASGANGYYAIKQLPSLWKYCRFEITVSAPGYTGEIKELILEEPLSHLDYNISLNLQQVTIRGILKDNYGIALADRWITLTAPNINLKDCSAKTDPNGRFEMKGCPDIDGLGLEAQLAWSNPYDMINQREQYDKMLYYPNVGINIPYSPNQKEYNIELTAIRPETQVDIFVTNSFGNPIPEMKVELDGHLDRNRHFNICWQRDKLQKRTNAEGFVKFDNIPPDAEELRVYIQQATDYILEVHRLDPFKERQRLQNLDRDYANLYQQMVIPIKLVPGQKKYQMTIVIPTKEEYQQQKESALVESLSHNP